MVERVPLTDRMQAQIDVWRMTTGRRETFLSCYRLMTQNMLAAIDRSEFNDGEWIYSLLQHFAGYYFEALVAFERDSLEPPAVWRKAHEAALQPGTLTLQNLLLGIDAHINSDLIFTLADMLEPDWAQLTPGECQGHYDDYTHVNRIIARTIDAVQEQILASSSPVMGWNDRLSGSVDKMVVASLLSLWREDVWERSLLLLDASAPEKARLRGQFEQHALQRAGLILLSPDPSGPPTIQETAS